MAKLQQGRRPLPGSSSSNTRARQRSMAALPLPTMVTRKDIPASPRLSLFRQRSMVALPSPVPVDSRLPNPRTEPSLHPDVYGFLAPSWMPPANPASTRLLGLAPTPSQDLGIVPTLPQTLGSILGVSRAPESDSLLSDCSWSPSDRLRVSDSVDASLGNRLRVFCRCHCRLPTPASIQQMLAPVPMPASSWTPSAPCCSRLRLHVVNTDSTNGLDTDSLGPEALNHDRLHPGSVPMLASI